MLKLLQLSTHTGSNSSGELINLIFLQWEELHPLKITKHNRCNIFNMEKYFFRNENSFVTVNIIKQKYEGKKPSGQTEF